MHVSAATLGCRSALAATAIGLIAAPAAFAHSSHATPAKASTQPVEIAFAAVAGDKPASCGKAITGLGTTNATAQLKDLRFYVSNVALTTSSGRSVPVKLRASASQLTRGSAAVTLIDLENGRGACAEDGTKALNARVRGTVPAGKYKGLSYTVGVPQSLNHTDVAGAPLPLNLAALGWSWQVGRKFLKIELAEPSFIVHVGSTGCTGNPTAGGNVNCTSPNRPRVRIASFDPARQRVAVDIKALFGGSTLPAAKSGMPMSHSAAMNMDMAMCMSGPGETKCGPLFGALGIAWNDVSGGGKSSAKQTVFRAIAR